MARHRRRLPAWTHAPTAWALRSLLTLPLVAGPVMSDGVAWLAGRAFAAAPFNRARFARAKAHIAQAFPGWDAGRVHDVAVHAYEHLFRLGVEFMLTPRLIHADNWSRTVHLDGVIGGGRDLGAADDPQAAVHHRRAYEIVLSRRPCVMITGHCGNWEVLGYGLAAVGFPVHALYRPLDNRALDRFVRGGRERRGLMLVDKFGASDRLPALMSSGQPLAFVADQNAGDKGLFVPYFGRLASTYKSIGLLAMRFEAPVICASAIRRAPDAGFPAYESSRFEIRVADIIEPQDWAGRPDPLFYLTARYRRALERMVREAPEQYLWMHRIWKSRPRHEREGRAVPRALIEKLRTLPWLSEEDVGMIVERSARESQERVGTPEGHA